MHNSTFDKRLSNLETAMFKHLKHMMIFSENISLEHQDSTSTGNQNKVLKQQCRDPPVLMLICDGECNLCTLCQR